MTSNELKVIQDWLLGTEEEGCGLRNARLTVEQETIDAVRALLEERDRLRKVVQLAYDEFIQYDGANEPGGSMERARLRVLRACKKVLNEDT